MGRYKREHYFRGLSNVCINYDEHDERVNGIETKRHVINNVSLLNSHKNSKTAFPKFTSLSGICVQEFNCFKIYYPLDFALNWPKDIWLPNPEAEEHMREALCETNSGILGYWNENIFLFVVKESYPVEKESFEEFFKNISLIKLDRNNDLYIEAKYT